MSEPSPPFGTDQMSEKLGENVECQNCGRKNVQLFLLTSDDIQRKYDPDQVKVCGDCLEKLRKATRLESDYGTFIAVRDLSLMASVFFALLVVTEISASSFLGPRSGAGTLAFLEGVVTVLTGMNIAWDSVKRRYAFTHSLPWSLKSRRVMTGISLIIAGASAAFFWSLLPQR